MSFGSIVSVSSGDTLVASHTGNLVVNGSFEADSGFVANGSPWATGTTLPNPMTLTGWSASGMQNSYAYWGHTPVGQVNFSDNLPDGQEGLYFGAYIIQSMASMPSFQANGVVTFSGAPNIVADPLFGPVTLSQTLTGLNTSATYLLDFWASGEDASTATWLDGFFGVDLTGENTLYFAAPGGQSGLGASQRYYVYFQPTSSTVTLTFTNWGHFYDQNGIFHSELCLDDVVVNQIVPEPASLAALSLGVLALHRRRRLHRSKA